MIDPMQVLSLALGHMAPPTWHVLPAQRSHFVTSIIGPIVCAVLIAAGLVYLYLNPNFAVGLLGSSDSETIFSFWRVADFVAGGVFVVGLIWAMFIAMGDFAGQQYQALVLLPEGFVMQRGTSMKTVTTVNYGTVANLRRVVNNGIPTLIFDGLPGSKAVRLRLDGRYGSPKQVADLIAAGYAQFASQRVRPS